jgi:signal transduction histidine kinase
LSNTGKHAHATRASIELVFDDLGSSIRISDDGNGFAVPERYIEFAASGHFGLLGMVERAEVIGATLTIQSTPGEGTGLILDLHSSTSFPLADTKT